MDLLKLTDNEIMQRVKPMWDNIILGSNQKNYQVFSTDFSTLMLSQAAQASIEEQWRNNVQLSDLAAEPEFMGCLRNTSGLRILWKQKFNKTSEECLGHMELVMENGELKIDGAQVL